MFLGGSCSALGYRHEILMHVLDLNSSHIPPEHRHHIESMLLTYAVICDGEKLPFGPITAFMTVMMPMVCKIFGSRIPYSLLAQNDIFIFSMFSPGSWKSILLQDKSIASVNYMPIYPEDMVQFSVNAGQASILHAPAHPSVRSELPNSAYVVSEHLYGGRRETKFISSNFVKCIPSMPYFRHMFVGLDAEDEIHARVFMQCLETYAYIESLQELYYSSSARDNNLNPTRRIALEYFHIVERMDVGAYNAHMMNLFIAQGYVVPSQSDIDRIAMKYRPAIGEKSNEDATPTTT